MDKLDLGAEQVVPVKKPKKIGDLYIEPYTRPEYVKESKSGKT